MPSQRDNDLATKVAQMEVQFARHDVALQEMQKDLEAVPKKLGEIEDWKRTTEAFITGAKWAFFFALPIILGLLGYVGCDYSTFKGQQQNLQAKYDEMLRQFPQLQEKTSQISNDLAHAEKQLAKLQDRLLGDLERAEVLVGAKWGVFIGPFSSHDLATHFFTSKRLDEKKYAVLRSFRNKGDYLIVFLPSLTPINKIEAESKISDLPDEVLNPEVQRVEPPKFPIALKPAGVRRVVMVDQVTEFKMPVINLPFKSHIQKALPDRISLIESVEHLQKLLSSKEFDPGTCEWVAIKYYDKPNNVFVDQGSPDNLKAFYPRP